MFVNVIAIAHWITLLATICVQYIVNNNLNICRAIFVVAKMKKVFFPFLTWVCQLFSIFVFALYFVDIYEYLGNLQWLFTLHIILKIYIFINFLIASLTDPGIIPYDCWTMRKMSKQCQLFKTKSPKAKRIIMNGVMIELPWCDTCQSYRPPRSYHCIKCKFCIESFDHHCIWIDNCIGRRNYRFFFAFIFLQSIDLILSLGVCTAIIIQQYECGSINRFFISTIIFDVILVIFTIPVLSLTIFHIIISFDGRTTYEFLCEIEMYPSSSQSACNWLNVLCKPLHPSLVNRR